MFSSRDKFHPTPTLTPPPSCPLVLLLHCYLLKLAYAFMCVWSEDNTEESILSYHHVGPRDWFQVIRLSDKPFHLLSHLTVPSPPLRIGYLVSFLIPVPKCLT